MRLEFELEEIETNGNYIMYSVKRKGENVGRLILDDPYNHPTAMRRLLTMHNHFIRSENEIKHELLNRMGLIKFENADKIQKVYK